MGNDHTGRLTRASPLLFNVPVEQDAGIESQPDSVYRRLSNVNRYVGQDPSQSGTDRGVTAFSCNTGLPSAIKQCAKALDGVRAHVEVSKNYQWTIWVRSAVLLQRVDTRP